MARGIPDIPLDGETYASAGVAGLPMVLEYDGPTGGYKLVVSTEAGVAINISGTVEVTGGQLTVVGAAQYGEDTPHTSGQTGTFIMGVRQDALASAVSADGDYAGLQLDSLGRLRVLSYGSNFLAPLNSSQYAEDSMFVGGSTGTMILAVRWDRAASLVSDDGDYSTLITDVLGRLHTFTSGSYNHILSDPALVASEDEVTAYVTGTLSTEITNQVIAAQYAEDSPHASGATGTLTLGVRQDAPTALAAEGDYTPFITDSLGRLHAFISGSYIGNFTAPVSLDASIATPTTTQVGSFLYGFDVWDSALWERLDSSGDDTDQRATRDSGILKVESRLVAVDAGLSSAVSRLRQEGITGSYALRTSLYAQQGVGNIYPGAPGNYALRVDPAGRLETVATVSGTVALSAVDIEIGAVELKDAVTDDRQRVTADGRAWVNAYITGTVSVDTELANGVVLSEGMGNPTPPAVGSFNMGFNGVDWDRLRVDSEYRLHTRAFVTGSVSIDGTVDTELPPAVVLSDGMGNPTPPAVGAFGMGWNGLDWNRIRVGSIGEQVVSVTGTVTVDSELPAAIAAADAMANPTAPQVLSHLMGYNGATWDRLYMGISGSLAVDLVSQLDAINDEVTAYVTGTLTVDTELPSAVVLSDGMATPTPPAVGAFGMGYDLVADDWNRIRLDAVTGAQLVGITGTVSVAVESDLPLIVTEDEVTAYITGSTSLNLMGKTITRVVIDFSGSVASETALVAAIGGQQIKVLEAMLIGNTDVTIFFQSGYTGTALTGPMSLPADGDGFFIETPAQMEAHHFETLSGEALVLDVDANVLLGGWLNYYAE